MPQSTTAIDASPAAAVHRSPMNKRKEPIQYTSGEALMALGAHALNEHVAAKMEAALGRALPQMDVRFRNLSLTAEVAVASEENHADSSSKPELPTLSNELKKGFAAIIAKKQSVRKEILKNVSGVFKPGTMTLVLGQPSSGKSSLMKILSGRFPVKSNVKADGSITYNGIAQATLFKRLPQFVTYTTQHDNHIPTLTVKETLEFAHKFSGGGFERRGDELLSNGTPEENKEAQDVTRALFEHHPEVIIQQLGLQNCQDTVVGDAMLRGVSGGERKRVTTGEMEFGMKYVTLMD
ncbi:Atp-binding protein, partial [Globisporangium polare]